MQMQFDKLLQFGSDRYSAVDVFIQTSHLNRNIIDKALNICGNADINHSEHANT